MYELISCWERLVTILHSLLTTVLRIDARVIIMVILTLNANVGIADIEFVQFVLLSTHLNMKGVLRKCLVQNCIILCTSIIV